MNNQWLCSTVGKFWQGVNWENQVVAQGISTSDRYITVKQFFQSIPWSMMPVAVDYDTSSDPPSNGQAQPSDTLDDFLQDVSKFF